MRFPSGIPVSPAMKVPPENQADDGDAEKRLPLASATSMVVVSRGFGSGPLLTAPGQLAVRTGRFAPEAGWNFHGSPGRAWLFAAEGSRTSMRATSQGP